MFLKFDHTSEDNDWKLLFISLFILPFQTFFGIVILLFLVYQGWKKNYQQIITDLTTRYLTILTGFIFISSFFAYKKGDAWLGIVHFFPFFILFLGVRSLVKNYQHLYYVILPIIFNSVIISCIGFGEVKLGWETPSFIYKTLGWRLISYGTPEGRMSSVFPHANPLSLYLFTALFFAFALLLDRIKKYKFARINIFLIITIIIDFIALILTSSRNGWIIAFIGFIVFVIYYNWYLILQLLSLAGIMISWASFGNLPLQNWVRKIVPSFIWLRLSDQLYPDRPLETLRFSQWNFCFDLIKDRPFFGWGLRGFSFLYEEKTNTYLGHPHNFFLMLGAEIGLIATGFFVFIIGNIYWQGIKTIYTFKNTGNNPIILFSFLVVFGGYTIYNFFDVSLFDLRLNILAWIILAFISGLSNQSQNVP